MWFFVARIEGHYKIGITQGEGRTLDHALIGLMALPPLKLASAEGRFLADLLRQAQKPVQEADSRVVAGNLAGSPPKGSV